MNSFCCFFIFFFLEWNYKKRIRKLVKNSISIGFARSY
ncbi:hypothetical protein B23_0701 [Geobacillus thermoleovorans B23]|nr:hypothetical protein B23_0701 [Geobacillus thermoleovorans B23]